MTVAVTRGAEGFPRRAFTVDEVRRMIEVGLIGEDEKFELVEGEIVPMQAKSIAHERIKHALVMALARAAGPELWVAGATTVQLGETTLVEPDLAVLARTVYDADPQSFARPRADDVVLLIEVAVSRLAYDRKVKARLYARHGIREFWVIDGETRTTFVHTGPAGDGFGSIVARGPDETLTCDALPGFSVRLDAIG